MTNTTQGCGSSFSMGAALVSALFLAALLVFTVVPYANAYGVLEKEWQQVLQGFGTWPAESTTYVMSWLNVKGNLANWLGLNSSGSDPVSVALVNWFQSRAPVVEAVLALIVLRLMVLLKGSLLFLPAGMVSLGCSLMQRKAVESCYTFTSPYKMTKMVQLFKFVLTALFFTLISPMALPKEVLSIEMGLLALLGGWLVSGLHKEI